MPHNSDKQIAHQFHGYTLEPLTEDELDYLKNRIQKDKTILRWCYAVAMVLIIILSIAANIYSDEEMGIVNELHWTNFIFSFLLLTSITTLAFFLSYKKFTQKFIKDVKAGFKVVMPTKILRKHFVPRTKQYFFFLSSRIKTSIEVEEDYYENLNVDDEVNLECTLYSQTYLGYY